MDSKEPLVLLNEVETAISTILKGGQSYKIGSRSLTRADLGTLIKLRNELLMQVQAGGGQLLANTSVAFFEGR
ncbi:peptidylprolyl isomerase [Anaerotignum propionicum]|uniref:peptidylprolyl isomerase n=1 Tax=Anaerotignum propionicum TaxID=28446 RepID=UPI0028A0A1EE|nr:peptidylprolyl isomerase [Anaerotignum propionicum]